MLVKDIDRFASNFGVDPDSITLQHIWTTPPNAKNIENVGSYFDDESYFGDGLTGLRGLGDCGDGSDPAYDIICGATTAGGATPPSTISLNLTPITNALNISTWTWANWALVVGGGFILLDMSNQSGKTRRR
jgi:hypothetical protein